MNNGHAGTELTTLEAVRDAILHLPGRPPFMLARDLARAYGCEVKQITQAARRNPALFPEPEARFALTNAERSGLLQAAHIERKATTRGLRGYTRIGSNMLAAFIRTRTAKERLLLIMRAFSALDEAAQAARPERGTPEWEVEFRRNEALRRFEKRFGKGEQAMERVASLSHRLTRQEGRIRQLEAETNDVLRAQVNGLLDAVCRLERRVEREAAAGPETVTVPLAEYRRLLAGRDAAPPPEPTRKKPVMPACVDAARLKAIQRYLARGLTRQEIARLVGIGRTSVNQALRAVHEGTEAAASTDGRKPRKDARAATPRRAAS